MNYSTFGILESNDKRLKTDLSLIINRLTRAGIMEIYARLR